jgi:hypothetical protein
MEHALEPTLRTMMRHPRRLVLALLALALALAGAGCGSGNDVSSTSLPVLEDFEPVAAATAKTDTARFEMELSMQVPGFDQPFAFTASGASDATSGKGEITMDVGSFADLIGSFAGSMGGDVPSGFADPEKWKLDLRLDGTVAYMRMPLLAGKLPGGKEWVRLDLQKAAAVQGLDLAQLQGFAEGSDPRQMLDFLRAVSSEITRIGTEEVRGVETTHYFAVVDFQKALADVAKKSGQPNLFAQLGGFGSTLQSVPVDVWVDADNLVRRMNMDLSFAVPGQSGEAKMSMAMELFDYGKPVSVDVPPASDTVDLSALTG